MPNSHHKRLAELQNEQQPDQPGQALSAAAPCTSSALPKTLGFCLPDEASSCVLGGEMAALLKPGMVVWFDGDLGAGKTTLVRAILRALGHKGAVKSPTYSLVEVYALSSINFHHFDFYRFNRPEEFEEAGLSEYFRADAVCLLEWPEKALGYVPPADLRCVLHTHGDGRRLELFADRAEGVRCLSYLHQSPALLARLIPTIMNAEGC
ncbi:MAG: tRNA (adenosine(37)-N6)-threonylcarbamoyltransferase complex ATPase subunit type 1 TsaE [Pseudomonadota bacterium]